MEAGRLGYKERKAERRSPEKKNEILVVGGGGGGGGGRRRLASKQANGRPFYFLDVLIRPVLKSPACIGMVLVRPGLNLPPLPLTFSSFQKRCSFGTH
jgi:hypothetical protein